MKLTEIQIASIEAYVNMAVFDADKLIAYLEKHRTVKNDIFKHIEKKDKCSSFPDENYSFYLNSATGFTPVERDVFIRRMPFYFYKADKCDKWRANLTNVLPISHLTKYSSETIPDELEETYRGLEFLFYEMKFSLSSIFSYCIDQTRIPRKPSKKKGIEALSEVISENIGDDPHLTSRDIFLDWVDYVHLCRKHGWEDYMPECFITSYNYALEADGQPPVMFHAVRHTFGQYFWRDGNSFICKGNFPCDKDGKPIMKWISIRVKKPRDISFNADKSQYGELKIELNPDTVIHAQLWYVPRKEEVIPNPDDNDDENGCWQQIYAGPLTMEFDYEALKAYRAVRNLTQNDVATAIGTSVRTYQKWESGTTTPDGHNLLRIMNWLDIDDVQSLIKYNSLNEEDNEW